MKSSLFRISSLIAIGLGALPAWGAACCGGGFATPSIISGDDRAQLTSSLGFTEVRINSVNSDGVWNNSEPHQQLETFKLEGAHIFQDEWQAGFSMPIINREFLGESSAGLGDINADIGYEFLPDWDYNLYRPKGIAFVQLTVPTGKSRVEAAGGLDSRGLGLWALGVGTVLTKVLGHWDALVSLDIHRSLPKPVKTGVVDGTLEPGFGGNLGMAAGFSLKAVWRLGAALAWTYEDPINIRGRTSIDGVPERFATATLSLSHMDGEDWAETLSYFDQTLFGSPVNTSLGTGALFQLQRRWGR